MTLPRLTQSQWELAAFIHRFISEHGYSPSFQEMAEGLGLASRSNIHGLLNVLTARCYIIQGLHKRRSPRSVALTDAGRERVEHYLAVLCSSPRETEEAA